MYLLAERKISISDKKNWFKRRITCEKSSNWNPLWSMHFFQTMHLCPCGIGIFLRQFLLAQYTLIGRKVAGNCMKLYEVNTWMWKFGRGTSRSIAAMEWSVYDMEHMRSSLSFTARAKQLEIRKHNRNLQWSKLCNPTYNLLFWFHTIS